MRLLISYYYKKFNLVICNSKYLGQYLKQKYNIQSKTLFPPSITTPNKTNKKIKKDNFKSFKVKIITVCRLSKEKNINEIIQAINQIEKEISLYVIGDGPEKGKHFKIDKVIEVRKKSKTYWF